MLDLEAQTIFLTLAGSQAHGTARAGSDVDLRGVCIAPLALRVSYRNHFEQYEGVLSGSLWDAIIPRLRAHPSASRGLDEKVETVIFDVAKFVKLCAAANPNALEVLFADASDWVHHTEHWAKLYARRALFLSRKVQQTYLGYAMAQLKRIRTHRSWLLNPPKARPARNEFQLPDRPTISHDDRNRIEQAVAEKLRSWDLDSLEMPRATRIAFAQRLQEFWCDTLGSSDDDLDGRLRTVAAESLELSDAMIASLGAERRYRAAVKHWESYERWKDERNPDRAALEARFGYDTKHAMHLIRLMRTGLETLRSGDLQVRRPDADELAAIRDGALSYEALLESAEALSAEMADATAHCTLPDDVDHDAIEQLLVALIEDFGALKAARH